LRDNLVTLNGHVVVHGPNVQIVENALGHPLQHLRLNDVQGKLGGLDRAAGVLHIFRPAIKDTVAETPKAVALHLAESHKSPEHAPNDAHERATAILESRHQAERNGNTNILSNNANTVIRGNTEHVPQHSEAPVHESQRSVPSAPVEHHESHTSVVETPHYSAPSSPAPSNNSSSSNNSNNSNNNTGRR
jgi:hypothetical protein